MRIGRINRRAVAELSELRRVTEEQDSQAAQILRDAWRLAPRRTGTLRRSLVVQRVRNPEGQTEFRVGWDLSIAEYGPIVEFGSEDTGAQPHLRPAANKAKGR